MEIHEAYDYVSAIGNFARDVEKDLEGTRCLKISSSASVTDTPRLFSPLRS
jgi:hypothetical protein